jgi:F0F1-type ATP synthase membrane subunit c/vacuolar-type H+-ATPase subunit K
LLSTSRAACILVLVDPETEAKARAIELAARERKRWPRGLWIAAILVSLICVLGLVVAWIQDSDTVAVKHPDQHAPVVSSGLWIGLLLGIGIGIVIGSVLAARAKK